MIILGLDPSLSCTGWGVIRAEGSRLTHIANGQIATDPRAPIAARLAALQAGLAQVSPRTGPTAPRRRRFSSTGTRNPP